MTLEKGDMVRINYIGKTTDGEIFDITDEEKAKEEGVYTDKMDYDPVPVLIGSEYVIEGLEEKIMEMSAGETEKDIKVTSAKAYGDRKSENIETYPEKEFNKQDVNVRRGDQVRVGNKKGKIISKGSGRIRIDFNHPLSGKDLVYDIDVLEKVEDDKEKAEAIFNYRIGHGDITFEEDTMKIDHRDHDHKLPEKLKEAVKEEVTDHTGVEDVIFDQ